MIANFRPYPGSSAILGIFLIMAGAAHAQVDDWTLAGSIVNSVRLPIDIPLKNHSRRDFNITDFGAVPDGKADARPAIMAAIEKAHKKGGGRVLIPQGLWFSKGPIHLKSKVNFHISKGATLLFSPDAADYLPPVRTQREGIEFYGYSPPIYAYQAQDVAISGEGLIDGNGKSEFHQWGTKQEAGLMKLRRQDNEGEPVEKRVYGAGSYLRPGMIQFIRCERVLLEDFALSHAPFRAIHLAYTDHATLRNTRIDSGHDGNEGLSLESSAYVLIENNSFRTGDSPLSIKSHRDRDGRQARRPSAYIVVRNNDMQGGRGILLGSQMSGGIRNIFFTDNILRAGRSAMLFEADMDRGGAVAHIRVRNMTVESAREHLFRFQLNLAAPYEGHPPVYRDLIFENITAGYAGTLLEAHAPREAPLRDVLLKNINIGRTDRNFVLENVEALRLENVMIGKQTVNARLDWKEAPLPEK